jgi:hypothetical protein
LLAIHGLNSSLGSSDFIISVALDATRMENGGSQEEPFANELRLLDDLRVTELMYHDVRGDEYDYIELQNIGAETLDLTGVRFTEGVEFTFPVLFLEPGQYVVVVADLVAFQSSYGTGIPVAGQYDGRLSNSGEDVVLKLAAPFEAALMRFRYDDGWYPTTDGAGASLVIEDPTAPAVTWNDPDNWRASTPTPGAP